MLRQFNGRKQEVRGHIESSGWLIGWVVSTGDISHMCAVDDWQMFDNSMDMLEHCVDSAIAVPTHFPSFNDSGIVTEDDEVLWAVEKSIKRTDQEFEGDGLSPSNVLGSSVRGPVRAKAPCSSLLTNDDTDSKTRTGI